jgi:hypothetical protein
VREREMVSTNKREQRKKEKKKKQTNKQKTEKKRRKSIHDLTFGVPEAYLHFDVLKVGDWWAGEARL